MTSKSNSNYKNFLIQHKQNKDTQDIQEWTHTRIGSKHHGVYAASYCIPDNSIDNFYKCYFNYVNNNEEYLTERQLKENGPILVDIDFRYNIDITTRQHTADHILDIVDLYMSEIMKLINIDEAILNIDIPIFIFEKPTVNNITTENITKDGLHMLIGLAMNHDIQCVLRDNILDKIHDVWGELPITNTWDKVLDEGITKGHTNWQLYNSRKPGHDAYKLTYYYNASIHSLETNYFELKEKDIHSIVLPNDYKLLSARNGTWPLVSINEKYKSKIKKKVVIKKKYSEPSEKILPYSEISDEDTLNIMLQNMLQELNLNEYCIRELHEYVMILPSEYYESGSYDKWIRVGFALKNASTQFQGSGKSDNRFFLTFLKFSSQSSEFSYSSVSELWSMWNKFNKKDNGLTKKSIIYWAKEDAIYHDYKRVKDDSVEHYLNLALKSSTEFDIANVLFQLYKDKYICTSVKDNKWYEYKSHKWNVNDSGNGLRMAISKDLHQVFIIKNTELQKEKLALLELCENDNPENPEQTPEQMKQIATIDEKIRICASITNTLKRTTHKNNIMREAREIFYDNKFIELQDSNPYLLGCNNGVYDFTIGEFRAGRPEDYLVKTTNNDYIPYEDLDSSIVDEINNFMKQLFPIEELLNYMWSHLASTLIGTIENQTFNIYNGSGRNGKSVLVNLMGKIIGDYKGTVPITLITQKRRGIGGTSSEVVALKGVRYAVMQEPSKGDVINEGIMKEITGGDPIQGRGLYCDSIVFNPQFKLVVCTNTLFDINSNDDGTWRRIRVVEFLSKFKEDPIDDDEDEPYQYKVDKKIDEKFEKWKSTMLSMLISIANKTKGNVQDCEMVMSKSNEYRIGQDYLAEFIKDKIVVDPDGIIKKQEVYNEFKEWYTQNYGRTIPKAKELENYINKKCCKFNVKLKCWKGIKIYYDNE